MSESLVVIQGSRKEQYENLIPQIKGLIQGEKDLIANMANISAALYAQFNWLWIGFYRLVNDELVLGPFQGPIACNRIKYGRGVCGTAWSTKQIQIVPDVNQFPGHIACSSLSKSEIVLPIIINDEVIGVLDLDSENLNEFSETDAHYLQQIIDLLVVETAP